MVKTAIKEALSGLVEDLRATHGTNLASVVLYGSAAAGDHIELRSDYNILIALNRITPEDLRQAQAPMREWQRLGHPLPVYFTVEELSDAADAVSFRSSFTRWPMRASFFTVTIRLSLHNFQTRICGIKLSMNSEAS
jgi:predicted nucleotidyltransferase